MRKDSSCKSDTAVRPALYCVSNGALKNLDDKPTRTAQLTCGSIVTVISIVVCCKKRVLAAYLLYLDITIGERLEYNQGVQRKRETMLFGQIRCVHQAKVRWEMNAIT